jgi:hypothetical protein
MAAVGTALWIGGVLTLELGERRAARASGRVSLDWRAQALRF